MTDEDPVLFRPFPASTKAEPKISIREDIGDDPNSHRWRAYWERDYDGTITGIELVPYPVVKLTPQGAQIDPHAWREWQTAGRAWHLTGDKRFVTNTGDQAWAKPTQERALHSVAVRLTRWARRLHNDQQNIRQAAHVLQQLRPDDAWLGKEAKDRLTIDRPTHYAMMCMKDVRTAVANLDPDNHGGGVVNPITGIYGGNDVATKDILAEALDRLEKAIKTLGEA